MIPLDFNKSSISVPLVGRVTDVFPVTVNVVVNAPETVTFPPIVIVLDPLLTPVPPYVAPISVPFQVPVLIVPMDTREERVVTAELTNVPEVGSVTVVLPVTISVVVNAPECVTLPPIVNVAEPLLTPVPPYVGLIAVPCQVPVPMVPMLVREDNVATPELMRVPEVGNVTVVLPVSVPQNVYAPENAVFPPIVIVDVPLLTPVPPTDAEKGDPYAAIDALIEAIDA
jgi:hypothetical protein